jgi:hypothetical protein
MILLIVVLIAIAFGGAVLFPRLPLTVLYLFSLAAFVISSARHGEPFDSLLELLRAPADYVIDLGGSYLGLGTPWVAGLCFGVVIAADMVLRSLLGRRR